MEYFGTISRGIKAPIIRKGNDISTIVINCLKNLVDKELVVLKDMDVVCITEAVVAKAQGNYVTLDNIACDISSKFNGDCVGLVFPILSRNRFAHILKGIKKGVKKLVIQLSYPYDEVGNCLMNIDEFDNNTQTLTYNQFIEKYSKYKHPFTDVDYIELYKEIGDCEIIFSNDPKAILDYTDNVIVGSIHNRDKIKKTLLKNNAKKVFCLDEVMNESINGSGYHKEYGVLGSNVAGDDKLKLFPRDCFTLVKEIQKKAFLEFNVNLEVMVYGDGAFKDPAFGIWELADPVVSPGYTDGLIGTPYEVKFKYVVDNQLHGLSEEEAVSTLKDIIKNKEKIKNEANRIGTTPRKTTDLLGSLADLTSGSGDKGTPIVLIQNFFTNYTS